MSQRFEIPKSDSVTLALSVMSTASKAILGGHQIGRRIHDTNEERFGFVHNWTTEQ
jgi:hypothetical protein